MMQIDRRAFVAGIATLLLAGAGTATAAAASDAAAAFIRDLGAKAIGVLSDPGQTPKQREEAFRQIFVSSFDTDAISQFVLGRYWRTATEAQRTEYQKLFQDFIVASYANRLGQYSGERFVVKGAKNDADGDAVVASLVERPDNVGQPVKIDWRLHGEDSGLKIIDVTVEGVSMAQTHRSEFAAVIQNNGGNVEALLTALRKKAAART